MEFTRRKSISFYIFDNNTAIRERLPGPDTKSYRKGYEQQANASEYIAGERQRGSVGDTA